MKKLFIIFSICIASLRLSAQNTKQPWLDLKMDSVSFAKTFGTSFEYGYQEQLKRQSSHHNLVVFIGAKIYWINEFSYYLQNQGWDVDFKDGDNFTKYTFTPNTSKISGNIYMTVYYNSDKRTTAMRITGNADNMIKLFVYYWEKSDISLNDLKSKGEITQDFVNDRISISWHGNNPEISIKKNPNIGINFATAHL